MSNHKATPSTDPSILELRARVKALEAQAGNYPEIPDSSTPPPVATDEELRRRYHNVFTLFGHTNTLRAIYDLGVAHEQARSREVAEPAPVAGGLVERISFEIRIGKTTLRCDEATAVAAILEQAEWLREQGWKKAADLLEQEAGR